MASKKDSYIHDSKYVTIPKEVVDKLFVINDNIEVAKKNYPNYICPELSKTLICPLNSLHFNHSKTSFTFYFTCILNKAKKYRLKCFKSDIKKNSDLKVEISSNFKGECDHKDEHASRQLRGSAREDVKEKLKNIKPKKFYRDSIKILDEELASKGNLQHFQNLSVLQKARSEALASEDLSNSEIEDLYLEYLDGSKTGNTKFIQKIDLVPFSVILFYEENFEILRNAFKNNKRLLLNIDATGGIVRSVTGVSLLHHVLLLAIKSNKENNRQVLLNIAELITEDQSSLNIEYFLKLVQTKFAMRYKQTKISFGIITDKSFANLNAIVKSQNNMTLSQYLQITYLLCTGQMNMNESPTLIFLCSSHFAKNLKEDIDSHFRNLDKDSIKFVYSLVGNMINLKDYKVLKDYILKMINLLCLQNKNSQYYELLQQLRTIINDFKTEPLFEFDSNSSSSKTDKEIFQSDDTEPLSNPKTIYGSSPFYKEFNDYYKSFTFDEEAKITNEYYNTNFVEVLLKQTIAYLPLWSAILYSIENENENDFRRPNNGTIERYFGCIKSELSQDISIGKLSNIKIGRYTRCLKERIKADAKEIKLKIPQRQKKSKKNEGEIDAFLASSQEQWKGKTKSSSSILYSTDILSKEIENRLREESLLSKRSSKSKAKKKN